MDGRVAGDLRRGAGLVVIWLAIPALAASAYYVLALIGALRWLRRPQRRGSDFSPPTPDLFSSPTLTVPSLIIVTSLLGG